VHLARRIGRRGARALRRQDRRGRPGQIRDEDRRDPQDDPFDPASVETLKLLRTWIKVDLPYSNLLGEPLSAECYGITAIGQDLAEVTESDRFRVNGFVLLAVLAILLILVRRFWLAAYLLVTVLASYYAALGATTLAGVFWTGHILTSVDWRVPFFLFIILVAVGEDYNILLMSRAIEERKRYGPSKACAALWPRPAAPSPPAA